MQTFRFRLQRVLDWQKRVCELEEESLRQRLAELAETQEQLAQLAARSVAMEQEFLDRREMAPGDLAALAEFRQKIVSDRRAREQDEIKRQDAVRQQGQRLLEERRRLKIFEKLRERALAVHTREMDRQLDALGMESHLSVKQAAASRELESATPRSAWPPE